MKRFFFDYFAHGQSLLDYRGQEFRDIQGAFDFAEAIVQDLKQSLTHNWDGWCVEVRNAAGDKFLCLPVDDETLRAA
jgi:hypothetical protein